MTPIENVFTMSADTILDDKTVEKSSTQGFSKSRFFCFNEPNNFIGMLLVRVLISYDPDDCLPISPLPPSHVARNFPEHILFEYSELLRGGKLTCASLVKSRAPSHGAIGV
nr:BFH_HP1_G0048470.mRNA.1.CDS.1 [Saccharomyces cerevisiae]